MINLSLTILLISVIQIFGVLNGKRPNNEQNVTG